MFKEISRCFKLRSSKWTRWISDTRHNTVMFISDELRNGIIPSSELWAREWSDSKPALLVDIWYIVSTLCFDSKILSVYVSVYVCVRESD